MFTKRNLPGNFDYVTPALIVEWAQEHGHSCYFLKNGTLVHEGVVGGHKPAIAFTED